MIAWLCGMESSVISTTIPSSACVVIAILDLAYGSTLVPQPIAYQARAVAKEIRQLKFEDENTPFHEELSIEEKDSSLGKRYFLKKRRYKSLQSVNSFVALIYQSEKRRDREEILISLVSVVMVVSIIMVVKCL